MLITRKGFVVLITLILATALTLGWTAVSQASMGTGASATTVDRSAFGGPGAGSGEPDVGQTDKSLPKGEPKSEPPGDPDNEGAWIMWLTAAWLARYL